MNRRLSKVLAKVAWLILEECLKAFLRRIFESDQIRIRPPCSTCIRLLACCHMPTQEPRDNAVASLSSRLEKLERANRRWRRTAVSLVLGGIVAVCLGQTRPAQRELDVDRITFRDPSGRVRMELAANRPIYGLEFYAEDGESVASMQLVCNTALLTMKGSHLDAQREAEKRLSAGKDPDPSLAEMATNRRITLSSALLGLAVIECKDGTIDQATMVTPAGVSVKQYVAGTGKAEAEATLSAKSIELRGGYVSVKDKDGGLGGARLGPVELTEPKSGATVNCPAGTLTLFNASGNVVERLPRP